MEDQVRQTGRDMGQRLAMERMRPRKIMTADAASSRREYQLRNYSATDILPPCQEMVPRLFDQGIEAVRPQGLIGQ